MARFGLLLSAWRDPAQSDHEHFVTLMTRAQAAADAGFSAVWANQRILADPWPAFDTTALISRASATVGAGLEYGAVYLFPLQNPVRLAETVLSLAALADHRFVVAGALGWRLAEFELLGIPIGERLTRFNRALEVLRAVTDPDVDDSALVSAWPQLKSWTAARGEHTRLPVWVGASSANGVRRALRTGDAWLASSHTPLRTLEEFCSVYEAAASSLDHRPARRPIFRHCMIADSAAGAERSFGPALRSYYTRLREMGLFKEVVGESALAGPDDLVSQLAIAGGVDQCIESFRAYARLGFTDFILQVGLPGVSDQAVLNAIGLLGTKVLPALNQA